MARVRPVILNFNGGVIARARRRVDLEWYGRACRQLLNMIAAAWGPAYRRPGTRYIGEVADSEKRTRLIDFVFSTVQAYMLEFGEAYFRFFIDKAQIVVAATDAAIVNGDFTAGIGSWADRSTGTASIAHDAGAGRLSLVNGTADIAWAEQSVATSFTGQEHVLLASVFGLPGEEIELRIGTSSTGSEIVADRKLAVGDHAVAFTPPASPFYVQFRNHLEKTMQVDDVAIHGAGALEIAHPFAQAELADVKWIQSADQLFLLHPAHHTRVLSRFGHSSWSLTPFAWRDGPYLDENATDNEMTPSSSTGPSITITADSTDGINDGRGFEATDIGRAITIKHDLPKVDKTVSPLPDAIELEDDESQWGWAIITGINSATQVAAQVQRRFVWNFIDGGTGSDYDNADDSSPAWKLGLYTPLNGYPAAATFHEQRLAFGGAPVQPDRVDLSKAGDFPTFTPEVDDDDGIAYVMAANQVNAIRWLVSGDALFVGTVGAEIRFGSSGGNAAISPSNALHRVQTRYGVKNIRPVTAGQSVLFVDFFGRKLREFKFNFELDSFIAPDKTIRNPVVGLAGFREIAYQREPYSVVWGALEDGNLVGFTYQPEEQVEAWHNHRLGGRFEGGAPVVEALAAIPGSRQDDLYMIVRRTINGVGKRYIEVLEPPLEEDDAQEDAFYVDCALTLDNPIAITGAAAADPLTITVPGNGLTVGARIRVTDVKGMVQLNTNSYRVKAVAGDILTLADEDNVAIDGSGFDPYIAGGVINQKVTVIAGLDHLEGETVQILADGARQADQAVVNGQIILTVPASVVQVGLGTTWRVEPQPVEVGGREQSSQAAKKHFGRVWILFDRTFGAATVNQDGRLEELPLRRVSHATDKAVPLFTGAYQVTSARGWEHEATVIVEGTHPGPATVEAIVVRGTVEDG